MDKTEYQIQAAFVTYMRLQYPKVLMTISPAGFIMSPGMAMKIMRMGYLKGTPDIMIFEPRGRYHGLFIEFKTIKGRLSQEQSAVLLSLTCKGYYTKVCRSTEEAVKVATAYLTLPDPRHEKDI